MAEQDEFPRHTMLTPGEAAAYLGVTETTLNTYLYQGRFRKYEINGIVGLSLGELADYRLEHPHKKTRPRKHVPEKESSIVSEQPAPLSIEEPLCGEAAMIQALIAHAFQVPGIIGIGRFMERPRTWQFDVTTARGPEVYLITRNIDGSFERKQLA